jgi:LacI family transcriptional regulator
LARTTRDFKHFDKVRKREIPLVFFDRILEGVDVSAVVLDDFHGGYQSVQHLLDQGCRRIAHFGGPQHLNIYKHRYEGYCQALRDHGLPVEDELVVFGDMALEDGIVGMRQLLALPQRPDAVFSSSDFSAVGAMQVIKEHQLRIPQDIALAGFSNETFTSLTSPMITTIDQHCEEMGRAAIRLLLEMVQERIHPLSPRKIVLQPQLLARESSRWGQG